MNFPGENRTIKTHTSYFKILADEEKYMILVRRVRKMNGKL